jgi:hypothetical protein
MNAAYKKVGTAMLPIVSTTPNDSYVYNGAVFKKQRRIKEEPGAC